MKTTPSALGAVLRISDYLQHLVEHGASSSGVDMRMRPARVVGQLSPRVVRGTRHGGGVPAVQEAEQQAA